MSAPAEPILPPAEESAVPVTAEKIPRSLSRTYTPVPGLFDEMKEPSGAVRPHWQMFVNLLDDLGPAALEKRWETARQLIHDNGVTYNVYGDPAGMDRPWNLDAIPFILGVSEWGEIEAGLAQRARLLDHVLEDIYGPQRLLTEGLLPAELVFGHRGFLRPMHGMNVPGNRRLHLYSVDVGRAANGRLHVLSDRTQAPSGAGYALENRLVVSRAMPDVFRDCRVQRLATFFRTLRDTLKALAPHNKENPRIVLLTPGPYNETYFEHAYLARYLGFTLVEGADLTVRDNHVYLKTLGGLQQVDVIFRRQDDDFCDPLDLRPDSTLGIPGLVQAIYAGNVAVANTLGSGILESPAFSMFLPRLAKHMLGEELKMAPAGSYWCGEDEARDYVLANLPRMVIKAAFPTGMREPIFAETLSQEKLGRLRERIQASPSDFVGEEQITLSAAPVLSGRTVQPRHVVFRAHLVATMGNGGGGDGYAVMPGGLTRFSASADSLSVSMQRGGGSKDTWVLAGGPVDHFSLLAPPGQPVDISRAGGDLPSRIADNLYWLGRYVERAESLVRLARGITVRLTDQNFESSPELPALLAALHRGSAGEINTDDRDHSLSAEQQLARILLDDRLATGLQADLGAIHRIASLVRDRISPDTWRIINSFDRDFPAGRNGAVHLNEILPALDGLIITFAAFGGLAMESMTRGFAWRFLDMGRRIERSLATLTLLRATLVNVPAREAPLLEAVLEVGDSVMTYRRRYMTSLQAAPVLDLLLVDESNPRSVAFQLVRISEHVEDLPRPGGVPGGDLTRRETAKLSSEERTLLRCLTGIRLADMVVEAQVKADAVVPNRRDHLDDLLHVLSTQLLVLSDTLSQTYLSHAITTRQLSGGDFGLNAGREREGAAQSPDASRPPADGNGAEGAL